MQGLTTILKHTFSGLCSKSIGSAIEHAKATQITIRGKISENLINLCVEDNGKGVFGGKTERN